MSTETGYFQRAHGLGVELFDDAEWDMSKIRSRYSSGFRRWEAGGYKPLRVPLDIRTRSVARCRFTIAGNEWTLATSRVEPLGDQWLNWTPFLSRAE